MYVVWMMVFNAILIFSKRSCNIYPKSQLTLLACACRTSLVALLFLLPPAPLTSCVVRCGGVGCRARVITLAIWQRHRSGSGGIRVRMQGLGKSSSLTHPATPPAFSLPGDPRFFFFFFWKGTPARTLPTRLPQFAIPLTAIYC